MDILLKWAKRGQSAFVLNILELVQWTQKTRKYKLHDNEVRG